MKSYEAVLKATSLITPIVQISPELSARIRYFVDKAPQECQWFHFVERDFDGPNAELIYKLSGFYVPEQEVDGTSTEADPQQVKTLAQELLEECKDDDGVCDYNRFNELVQGLTAWCHSHVNLAPSPSSTDNDNFKDLIKSFAETDKPVPTLMLIFNKRDEYFCRVYDPDLQLVFDGVKIREGEVVVYDYSDLDEALENKVKKKEFTSAVNTKGTTVNPTKSGGTSSANRSGYTPGAAVAQKSKKLLDFHEEQEALKKK